VRGDKGELVTATKEADKYKDEGFIFNGVLTTVPMESVVGALLSSEGALMNGRSSITAKIPTAIITKTSCQTSCLAASVRQEGR